MNAQGGHFQFQLKPNIGGGQAAKGGVGLTAELVVKILECFVSTE